MRWVLSVCLLLALPAMSLTMSFGADAPKQGTTKPSREALPPPPIPKTETRSAPPADESDQNIEPEVTITTRDNVTYEEYRINGRLYMVKVTPKTGKPYYLIDKEGTGQFQRSDLDSRISVPNWVIKSW